MSLIVDCYLNIFGLSRNDCDCYDFTGGDPTVSRSGFFLDEVEGLNLTVLKSITDNDCEAGSLFDLMNQSRNEAAEIFKSDIAIAVSTRASLARPAFNGYIADREFTRTLSLTTAMAGLELYSNNVRAGVFKLRRIGLVFNQVSTFELQLWDNLSDTELYSWTVTTVAGKLTWFDIPEGTIELPLSNKFCDNYRYYFVFPVHFNMPKDNPVHCGCGHQPVFCIEEPEFIDNSKYPWTKWAMVTGVTGNDITLRDDWRTEREANGLVLDGSFTCRINQLLCDEEMDFEGDPLSGKIALVQRYKAAEILAIKILSSTSLSRYTMINREILIANAGMYLSSYQSGIFELANEIVKPENINKYSDCFTCNPDHGFRKGKIRVT